MQYYNLDINYIRGATNKIADCISRLTRNIREAEHVKIAEPMLATVAKSAKKYTRQVQCSDPWVIQLGAAAMQDKDYLAMVHNIENGVTAK